MALLFRRQSDHPTDTKTVELEHVIYHKASIFADDDERTTFATQADAKAFLRQCAATGRWAEYRQEPKRG